MFGVKKSAFVAVAAAVALSVGACTAHPGSAATVNGVSFSDAQVAEASQQFSQISGRPLDAAQLVQMLPSLVAYEEAGQEVGVTFTKEQVKQVVDSLIQQGSVRSYDGELGSLTADLLSVSLMVTQVRQTNPNFDFQSVVQEKMAHQDVQVNPRYGKPNPMTGQVVIPTFADVVLASETNAQSPAQQQ